MIKTVDEVYATEMKTYWNKGNKKMQKNIKEEYKYILH